MNIPFTISPGALLNIGEKLTIIVNEPCVILIKKIAENRIIQKFISGDKGIFEYTPESGGSYVLLYESHTEKLSRYLGVVDKGWAVCQMTVGAFTAEDFAAEFHFAPVPADYYIWKEQFEESKWREYERQFGDAIHPHVEANDFGTIDKSLAHENPNWDSLTTEQIIERIEGLKNYWLHLGYSPLDRIATYTPCNKFIEACRKTGIRILHSVIPEQNWSDGEWSINHWGMPTCPFWVASDDFRKPAVRTPDGVLAMTMNHYNVLLPHLTNWGDFVLSPSHFCRWHRSCDSGSFPARFKQFIFDILANASNNTEHPFFFVAGFEFGRTFGTGKMTDFNREGIKILIKLSSEKPLVFASSHDVLLYYQRHISSFAYRISHERDVWAGAVTMGKPGIADDAIVIERPDYKALIRQNNHLPWFHYDYKQKWNYDTSATNVPVNFAEQNSSEINTNRFEDIIEIKADKPIARAIPFVVWDARITESSFPTNKLAVLDDGRQHEMIELPKGWEGLCKIKVKEHLSQPMNEPAWWQCKTFGEGDRIHTYLFFDLPLLEDVQIPIELLADAAVDDPHATIGFVPAGRFVLNIGPQRTWYRFRGIDRNCIRPTQETIDSIKRLRPKIELLGANWSEQIDEHCSKLESALLSKFKIEKNKIALSVYCSGKLPLGSKSRAANVDIVKSQYRGLTANEYGDGALCFGPGKNFWIHPRGLPFKIHGLKQLAKKNIRVILSSFDTFGLNSCYKVTCAGNKLSKWILPTSPFAPEAWCDIKIKPEWIDKDGTINLHLKCDQKEVLYDWWKEKGFVAGLHALWVIID